MAAAGQKTIIRENIMPRKIKHSKELNIKLNQIIDLLKIALSLNDEEITKSTIESVIELLEEEIIE